MAASKNKNYAKKVKKKIKKHHQSINRIRLFCRSKEPMRLFNRFLHSVPCPGRGHLHRRPVSWTLWPRPSPPLGLLKGHLSLPPRSIHSRFIHFHFILTECSGQKANKNKTLWEKKNFLRWQNRPWWADPLRSKHFRPSQARGVRHFVVGVVSAPRKGRKVNCF